MSRGHELRRALIRQAPFMGLIFVVLAAVSVPYWLTLRDQYGSSVVAAYDQRDALGLADASGGASRFDQIVATLGARLKEPEFLWLVASAVELSLDPGSGAPLPDDSSSKARVAELLAPTLRVSASPEGRTFTVHVTADDPLTARRLGDAVMELFIQKELRYEAETLHRLYESHKRFLEESLTTQAKAGPPSPGGERGRGESEFLPRLEERVRELDLEWRRLAAQIDRPAERTRFRVTVPATYDDVPSKRTRRSAALGLGAATLLLVFGAGTLRELFTPLARSARRVRQATGLPVLAEVPRAVLRKFPAITREQARLLRDDARREGASGPAPEAWNVYQDIDRALGRVNVGPVVFLSSPGPVSTCAFVDSLLNVTSLDQTEMRLVIDGDAQDPLGNPEERGRVAGDLGQFLAGRISWKEIRLNRTSERPYDLVYASGIEQDRTAYSSSLIARLFTSLCRGYGRVFVRALDRRFEVENTALAKAATDCILIVQARRTRLVDVERAKAMLEPSKIRGVILIDV